MNKVIILKGLPASGKTTWAKEQVARDPEKYKRINKDDLREMLDGSHWSKQNESFVVQVRNSLILQALEAGKDVIVDDTNLNPVHEKVIRKLVEGKAEVTLRKFYGVSVEQCILNDAEREKPVGRKVICDMYNKWLRPVSITKKRCI